jgi:hypothetical protein
MGTHMKKYGLMMHLPEGKLPGFYAQVVKNVAAAAPLFDRDKELLIVSTEEERSSVTVALAKMKIDCEPLDLLLLPERAQTGDLFEDYGFESIFGNKYLYADRAVLFRFPKEQPADAEPAPAHEQLEEHIIIECKEEEGKLYGIELHLKETAEGIARRFGCKLDFL